MSDAIPSLARIEAELAARSLVDFTEQAWPIIEPRTTFVRNWHIDAIADHLTAITNGDLKTDLLINVPPGTMKSILVSVMWPAWEWTRRPHLRYLCASYDDSLSIRDTRKMRDIVTSPWYQRNWPMKLREDQNTKTRFDNAATGWRIATSVGGRATGEHPHRKIVDDPHNVRRSLSAVSRREAIMWFDLTLGSRGVSLGATTVVIMQRLHEEDLSGHILNELRDRFTLICLPMRYEPPAMVDLGDGAGKRMIPRMPPTPLGFTDPRTRSGELLWPDLFTELKTSALEERLRATHGEFGVAGQLQQRPVPETGGMFKEAWLPIVDARPAPATVVRRVRGWDCAATEGGGDFSVGVLLALTKDGIVYVEDVKRGRWGPDEFEGEHGILKSTAVSDGKLVRIREEQEPGSAGKKIVDLHAKLLMGYDYTGKPSTGDKVTRARPFQSQASVGNVRIVRGAWNRDYIKELTTFPNATYDDQVDATSGAFDELTAPEERTYTSATWGR